MQLCCNQSCYCCSSICFITIQKQVAYYFNQLAKDILLTSKQATYMQLYSFMLLDPCNYIMCSTCNVRLVAIRSSCIMINHHVVWLYSYTLQLMHEEVNTLYGIHNFGYQLLITTIHTHVFLLQAAAKVLQFLMKLYLKLRGQRDL